MRRSVATVSLSGTLPQKLAAIAAAGFDAIELFEPDFVQFSGSARDVAALVRDHGLAIDLYQPLRDMEGVPDAVFARNLERAERKFDVMQELGAPLVLVCSNTAPAALPDPARAAAQLHTLAERAARRGLRVGYEALAWGRHVKRWRQAWELVQGGAHPALGLILDSFHTLSLRDDPCGIAEVPGERIFFVQMADAPILAMDVLQWARHYRNFPGQGQFDVDGFFEQVLRSGYTGTLSLEIFNDVFRETPNRRIAVDALRSLLFLESRVRERLAQRAAADDAAAARALRANALFDPPALPAQGGCAFIEFGVDEASGAELRALLGRMGFEPGATHPSGALTLHQQGGIRLVVDSLHESTGRERFDEMGPTVSALGLASDDPEGAARRATALLSAAVQAPSGIDDRVLPAIRAPGGMVLRFVPRAAAGAAPAGPAGCGLRSVDHVALGMAPDQLDTWVLFARSVLGLHPGESLELADPFGLVRTCGMADDARALRIVLNVSSSSRTASARAARASGGRPFVHHIAFGCDDLCATVESMRGRGVPFVPISGNYYDDLQARHGLDDAFTARLRELGILFDRNDAGDYLHIYTEAFHGRFFFELVQRAGYDAYGAHNATARMASQAQAEPVPPPATEPVMP